MSSPIDRALGDSEEPLAGAHIISPRLGYNHHGIYLGNRQVVHYGGARGSLPGGRVEVTSLKCFARQKPLLLRCSGGAAFSAQQVLDRARSAWARIVMIG